MKWALAGGIILSMLCFGVASDSKNSTKFIPEHLDLRKKVIASLVETAQAQILLPVEYSHCLFASYEQSLRGNSEAHDAFLNQVDFLANLGAGSEFIVSLISYGQAIGNMIYASHKNIPLNQLINDDLLALSIHYADTFDSKSCRKFFYDYRYKQSIKKLLDNYFS